MLRIPTQRGQLHPVRDGDLLAQVDEHGGRPGCGGVARAESSLLAPVGLEFTLRFRVILK